MSEIVKQDAETVIMKMEVLKDWLGDSLTQKSFKEAIDIAIQSIQEVEQYRALGTVEELKEAREKQVAKKPTEFNAITNGRFYALDFMCPSCNEANIGNPYTPKYCKHCGQALKWGEEDD